MITGRHDSIEADSIVKSAKNADSKLSLGDSDSRLGKAQSVGKAVASTVADKAEALTDQKNAVADSLDHIKDNVVTAAKGNKLTDPEQEFEQGELAQFHTLHEQISICISLVMMCCLCQHACKLKFCCQNWLHASVLRSDSCD